MRTIIALTAALTTSLFYAAQAGTPSYEVDVVIDHSHPAYQNSDKRWYEENNGLPIPVKHDENGTAYLSVRDQTDHPAFKDFHKRYYEHLDGRSVPVRYDENGTALLSLTDDTSPNLSAKDKRGVVVPGVYICARRKWGGPCYWDPVAINQCYGFRDPIPDVDMIGRFGEGSFGIDHGIKCRFFSADSCGITGGNWISAWLQWPGVKGRPGDMLYIPSQANQADEVVNAYVCVPP